MVAKAEPKTPGPVLKPLAPEGHRPTTACTHTRTLRPKSTFLKTDSCLPLQPSTHLVPGVWNGNVFDGFVRPRPSTFHLLVITSGRMDGRIVRAFVRILALRTHRRGVALCQRGSSSNSRQSVVSGSCFDHFSLLSFRNPPGRLTANSNEIMLSPEAPAGHVPCPAR